MKTISNNLKYFALFTLILSILFFNYLYSSLEKDVYNNIVLFAILYGASVFISGLIYGFREKVRHTRGDIEFRYHLVTFSIVNSVGITFLIIYMGLNFKNVLIISSQLFFWGIGLLVHYYFSSRSIKGMDAGEIFK